MKTSLSLFLLLVAAASHAQLTDDFSDGNFTANPVWSGTTADFIVNTGHELKIDNIAAATSYLSVPHGLSSLDNKEWRIRVKQSFAPSAANFGRIYLVSTAADLSTDPDGFYLQLGEAGSLDAIRLCQRNAGSTTELCAGVAGQIAASFTIGIRVVRSAAGVWSLYVDETGGTDYTPAASGTETSDMTGTHFGVLGTYTITNANKFFYDNIYVGAEIVDSQPPALTSAAAVSATEIDVLFSEPVSGPAAAIPGNYLLNPAVNVSAAAIDGSNGALVHLTLSGNLQNGQNYGLTVSSIDDMTGNTASDLTGSFNYLVNETPVKGDVIITEFFCDPSPVIGLAEVEFIEVHNRSGKYFDLTGWKIGDGSGDGTITAGWIAPGEYKILCASSSLADYPNGFAATSFPSLNNSGDEIVLKDTGQNEIDRIVYDDSWYHDAFKQEGGYTIELINPGDPCSDRSNWTASNAFSGGTPGIQNSVYDNAPDMQVPTLVSTQANAPNLLELTFSEGMDSASLASALLNTDPDLAVSATVIPSAFPETMEIAFVGNITASQLYTFTIGPVTDCWMNVATISGSFALAEEPVPGDIVINEILFDPETGGSDFAELYNRSQKILDLENYSIANYDNGSIANLQTIADNYLLFPGEYVVLTADSSFQLSQFPHAVPGTFRELSLPSFDNDSSTVYLLYDSVLVLDKVSYSAGWHLVLIDDTENKTLERIDPAGISSYGGNWHTAAETIGFGTPGGQNSQYQPGSVNGEFGTLQKIFSPDNDGFEDVLQFFYTMPQPGMIATLKIFDDQGRTVRKLLQSELLGLEGNVSWDGINDDEAKAGMGIYIAVIEAFSVDGSANYSQRIAFTLAGKLD
jgi:hypothetical protein